MAVDTFPEDVTIRIPDEHACSKLAKEVIAQASEMIGPIRRPRAITGEVAIIVDSACDVPVSYLDAYPFYVVPLSINYADESYLDRVNITPSEVVERFETEIPKTAAAAPGLVHEAFEQARDDGYTKIIALSISSGLSTTCDVMCGMAELFPKLQIEVIDTLNIGIACGMIAAYAAEQLSKGASFDEAVARTRDIVPKTHIFFIPNGLEYLYKGGRITKTIYALGSVLNLRPVLTCDENGKYVVAGKARGRKKSIEKAFELAGKCREPETRYRFIAAQGAAEEEEQAMLARAAELFDDAEEIVDGKDISPALVVHTGPGLLGMVVQSLD